MNVGVFEDYGPFRIGNSYQVLSEKFDYFILKCKGSSIRVPKTLINFNPDRVIKRTEPNYEDEEEFMDYLEDFYMDGV